MGTDNGLCGAGSDNGCANMGIGDGDCDQDSDCAGDLRCGTDNCNYFRPSGGWPSSSAHSWDTTDDCCYQHTDLEAETWEADNSLCGAGNDTPDCANMGIGDGDC